MRTLVLTALTLLLAAGPGAASPIYKIIDKDGRVVFTDKPPPAGANATEIELESGNSFDTAPLVDPEPWIVEDAGAESAETEAAGYESAIIVAPANDEAVRDNAGNVAVIAAVTPALQEGHRLRLLLDGLPQATTRGLEFTLTNVDRGTHTVAVEVVDTTGAVLLRGASSTFHLQRYSALSTPNPGQRPPPRPAPRSG